MNGVTVTSTLISSDLSRCSTLTAITRSPNSGIIYFTCEGDYNGIAGGVFSIGNTGTVTMIATSSQCFKPTSIYAANTGIIFVGCSARRLGSAYITNSSSIVAIDSTVVTPIVNSTECMRPLSIAGSSATNSIYAVCSGPDPSAYGNGKNVIAIQWSSAALNAAITTVTTEGDCRTPMHVYASSAVRDSVFVACQDDNRGGLLSIVGTTVSYLAFPSECSRTYYAYESVTGFIYAACYGSPSNVIAVEILPCMNGWEWDGTAGTCRNCPMGRYRSFMMENARPVVQYCAGCESGTVADRMGSSFCSQCPAGQYASSAASCTLCPLGYYSPSPGYSSCLLCTPGRYSNVSGSTSCSLCPVGSSSSSASPECNACPAGRYANVTDSPSCSPCPAGRYADNDRSSSCSDCPVGRFMNRKGSIECNLCSAGRYSNVSGLSECTPCPIGAISGDGSGYCEWCPVGSSTPRNGSMSCIGCSVGTFYSRISRACQPCTAGSFQSRDGQTYCDLCKVGKYQPSSSSPSPSCIDCSAGKFADSTGQSFCAECSIGRFSNNAGASVCLSCKTGQTNFVNGSIDCFDCSVGTYYSSITRDCQYCKSGYYQDEAGKADCKVCPPGNYQSSDASSPTPSCIKCPAGTYSDQPASAECSPCPIGRFTKNAASTTCESCPEGSSTNGIGSIDCFGCSIGTYYSKISKVCEFCPAGRAQDKSMKTECDLCSIGRSQPSNSSASPSCIICPSGRYSNSIGQAFCYPCDIGKFNDYQGASDCGACPAGTANTVKGSTSCTGCSVGRYQSSITNQCENCPEGSYQKEEGKTDCIACEVGSYQSSRDKLSPSCIACFPGTFSNQTGAVSCRPCPAGRFSSVRNASACLDCAIGKFTSADGSASCNSCPFGEYSDQEGQSKCTPCPAGRYSDSLTSTTCYNCPVGRFAAGLGTRECQICPLSTYQLLKGSTECLPCLGIAGVNCLNGEIRAEKGYFLTLGGPNNSIAAAIPCASTEICTGGSLGNQCAPHRKTSLDNLLCGECDDGYIEWQGKCIICDKTNGGLVFLILVAFWVYVVFIHYSSKKSDGLMNVFMYFIQTALIIAGSPSKWISWINVLSLSPLDIGASDSDSSCILPLNGYQNMGLGVVISLIFFALHALNCLIHYSVFKCIQKYSLSNANYTNKILFKLHEIFSEWRLSPYLRSYVSLLLFSYSQVTVAVLRYLQCVDVGGERVVFTSPSVRCDDEKYKRWLPVVILVLVLYVIGLPLMALIFFILRRDWIRSFHPTTLHDTGVIPMSPTGQSASSPSPPPGSPSASPRDLISTKDHHRFHLRWSILYGLYRSSAFFWHIVILIRRTMIISIFTYLYRYPSDRQMIVQIIHILSFIIQLYFQPFRDKICNIMEIISLLSLVIIGAIMSTHPLTYSEEQKVFVSLFILAPLVLFIAAILIKKMLHHHQKYQRTKFVGKILSDNIWMKELFNIETNDKPDDRLEIDPNEVRRDKTNGTEKSVRRHSATPLDMNGIEMGTTTNPIVMKRINTSRSNFPMHINPLTTGSSQILSAPPLPSARTNEERSDDTLPNTSD